MDWNKRVALYQKTQGDYRAAMDQAVGDLCCGYCWEAPAQTVDHVIPRSAGGTDDPSNLIAVCRPCNLSKGKKSLMEWSEHLLRLTETGERARRTRESVENIRLWQELNTKGAARVNADGTLA